MKYSADFQFMPKGAARPLDEGIIVGIESASGKSDPPFPNVGDFVHIISMNGNEASFQGRVRSRLFRYFVGDDGAQSCGVNIVVEETDDDWGKLIKE